MVEVYQRIVGDLQWRHQLEVATILKERDRLLKEETSATVAGKTSPLSPLVGEISPPFQMLALLLVSPAAS